MRVMRTTAPSLSLIIFVIVLLPKILYYTKEKGASPTRDTEEAKRRVRHHPKEGDGKAAEHNRVILSSCTRAVSICRCRALILFVVPDASC